MNLSDDEFGKLMQVIEQCCSAEAAQDNWASLKDEEIRERALAVAENVIQGWYSTSEKVDDSYLREHISFLSEKYFWEKVKKMRLSL